MTKRFIAASAAALVIATASLALPAFAQSGHSGHGSHGGHSAHGARGAAAETAATKEYRAANDRMHKDMDIAFTGDADADFIRGMIPHHQGAIDMARVVLRHGKDAETRKLAETIIADQEREIAQMKAWLAARGK